MAYIHTLAAIFTMRVFILIIVLFFYGLTFSQDVNFEEVDNYVETLQYDSGITLDKLTLLLTKPFASPTLKTRAIYHWLAKNITYDHEGYKTDFWEKYPSQQALLIDTYKFKKGVCSGYSHLLKYMLNKAKIECEVIDGYSRADLETVIHVESNHAWNAVKLNNKWFLIDVTWSAASLAKELDDFWFMTSPDIFILNHFPDDRKWTLTNEVFNLIDFKRFPVYTRSLFEMAIVDDFVKEGYYQTTNSQVTVKFKTTRPFVWLTKLYDLEKGEWFSPKKVDDKAFEKGYIKLNIDRKGKFILKLDALEKGDSSFTINNDLVYYIIESK